MAERDAMEMNLEESSPWSEVVKLAETATGSAEMYEARDRVARGDARVDSWDERERCACVES